MIWNKVALDESVILHRLTQNSRNTVMQASTKSGAWDLWTRERGKLGRWEVGKWGLGEVVREDFGTRRRAGIRGSDKQITPDFCAELVKYFFEGQL